MGLKFKQFFGFTATTCLSILAATYAWDLESTLLFGIVAYLIAFIIIDGIFKLER